MYRHISQGGWTFRTLRDFRRNSATEFLGLRITAIGPDFVIGDMPVDERTRQPYGLLHGGMSLVLAEELGSLASGMLVADEAGAQPVGVDIGGSHLRAVRSGRVTGVCRALKLGRNTHFWRVDVRDESGRLCCSANLTVQIVRREPAAGS